MLSFNCIFVNLTEAGAGDHGYSQVSVFLTDAGQETVALWNSLAHEAKGDEIIFSSTKQLESAEKCKCSVKFREQQRRNSNKSFYLNLRYCKIDCASFMLYEHRVSVTVEVTVK